MAVNSFFSDLYTATTMDQVLFDDLITESIQIHGRDFSYLPRTLTNFDSFFGEDAVSAFNDIATVEMYLENVTGWQGDEKFLSKFGLEIRDEATLIVARSRFRDEITAAFPDIERPREGDVVVFPHEVDKRTRAFEISYVDGESVFYQLGELYIWKLKVRNFEYNGESFDTGVPSIDAYETTNSLATVLDLAVGTGSYVVGETVTQPFWSATVVMYVAGMLTVTGTVGDVDPTVAIVGSTSGASWTIEDVVTTTAQDSGNADNKYIEESDIVDFSEKNPFSGT